MKAAGRWATKGDLVGEGFEFQVVDTQKDGQLVIHHGHLTNGVMHEGAEVKAVVDAKRRDGIRRAHSATHILHHALQHHLGSHAQQQGSKVDDDWLRFDFTNLSPVASEQLADIGADVTKRVAAAESIRWDVLPLAEARSQGAMMLFGEKYPDPVRMVSMGDFSKELCGGTHLTSTGEVEAFEILSEEGVSAGTRRITALTGRRAKEHGEQISRALEQTAETIGCAPSVVPSSIHALLEQQKELRKMLASGGMNDLADPAGTSIGVTEEKISSAKARDLLAESAHLLSVAPLSVPERAAAVVEEVQSLRHRLDQRAAAGPITADGLLESASKLGDATIVVAETPTAEPNLMRQLIDQIRQKAGSSAVLLASSEGDDKVTLVAGVSKDLQDQGAHAGNWVKPVAQTLGGGGGGRPDMAQAGGKQPDKLPAALELARKTIAEMLGA